MIDLLKFLSEWFLSYGLPGIASMIGVLIVGLPVLIPLGTKLWKALQQRQLSKDLHPFYTAQEIQRATQYYVETKCQNIAPSRDEELRTSRPFSAKERIIPFFLKEAFQPLKDDCQFYLVLADSGMGKTTFLLNLYLRYINQFVKPQYRITLFPLAFPDIDKHIDAIPDEVKRQTILLLDAFDEDIQAVQDYTTRLNALIQKVLFFREVIITCRTQFFPSEVEEPGHAGVFHFGPEGGDRVFHKFYLSPFDDKDIQSYLRKRFRWWQWRKKTKARNIVQACPNLMVRPMLLSHIEDLLQSERPYTTAYQVYAELISRWIEREVLKVPYERRQRYHEELFTFSREIARDMYQQRTERQGSLFIPGQEMQPFAEKHHIRLSELEMKSRSLLNRDALGQYKFSHKSVLEYFLAEEAFFNPEFRQTFDFGGMNQAKIFFEEMVREQLTMPFFGQPELNGQYGTRTSSSQALATLPVKNLSGTLPAITSLKLYAWTPADDALLFHGLPHLKQLEFVGDIIEPAQVQTIHQVLPECTVTVRFKTLRSQPMVVLEQDAPKIFDVNDVPGRPHEYIQNEYEARKDVVFDYVTGLTWERVGSQKELTYAQALEYIGDLNRRKFAGYDNWRLPTIPELMSLLEPEEKNKDLYIDPVFDKTQRWCWSADKQTKGESSPESAWDVLFDVGNVYWSLLINFYYVRAVRS